MKDSRANDYPERTRHSLSPREEAFCAAVLSGCIPTDAYRQVYKPQRAKPKTIHEMASRLMAKHKVRARLVELMKPVIAKAQTRRERWLEHISKIIESDVRKMFDAQGNPLELSELGPNEAATVSGFELCENFEGKGESRKAVGYTKKFKLADRIRALELYGKAQCYYAEKMELTDKDGNPIHANNDITVEFVSASHPRQEISDGANSFSDPHVPDR
mgnify:CR=1 FL=1